jgi:hypothetical protein
MPHFAFKQDYPGLTTRVVTEVDIFNPLTGGSIKAQALWDTGATSTVITHKIFQALNFLPINRVKVSGVNNTSIADVVNISVGLPNKVIGDTVKAAVCDLMPGIDMLIGMNIIMLGDFSISNGGGKTLFTFAIPPFENKTDLYEKTLALNRRSKL